MSALAAPINLGNVRGSLGRGAERRKRHLVLVSAAHLRGLLPPADCTRSLLAALTQTIERRMTRSPGARGVNTKFVQRDQVCDKIYRSLRALPAKAPWPRCADGTRMSRAQLEGVVSTNRWWLTAIKARREAYALESEADLEAFRNLITQPMPLEERVRRYAPPLVLPARIAVGRDVKLVSDSELAVLSQDERRRLARDRAALGVEMVERARKLAVIHRRLLGVG